MKSKNTRQSVNPMVSVSPSRLAAAFITDNSLPSDPRIAEILRLYEAGLYSDAKIFMEAVIGDYALQQTPFDKLRQFRALLFKAGGSRRSLKDEALEKFLSCEDLCRETNLRLGLDRLLPDIPERNILLKARHLISQWLPPLTEGIKKRILLLSRPGPGLSLGSMNPHRTALGWKYTATLPVATERALPYANWLISSSPLWKEAIRSFGKDGFVRTQQHNRVTFVPKNVTSLRSIAIEPSLNVMLQLGVDQYFKKILRSVGNDIELEVRERFGDLARIASITGDMSTVDLSAASDTLSIALVYQLLPLDWCCFLSDLRSPQGLLPNGQTITYEKFSSMGNGTTFPLETMCFLALGRACAGKRVVVFGDDIICPTESTALLYRVLDVCGFKVNTEKSFTSGPFRESCGNDYFSGINVTPKYWSHNRKVRVSGIYEFLNEFPCRFNKGALQNYLVQSISQVTKLNFIPPWGQADHGLRVPMNYLRGIGAVRWCNRLQTYRYRAIQTVPVVDRSANTLDRLLCLSASGTCVLPLRDVVKYRRRWVY